VKAQRENLPKDERYVKKMQAKLTRQTADINIARAQRRGECHRWRASRRRTLDRNRAILAAHDTGEYSYAQIPQHFGVHFTTVGRIVRADRSFRRKVKSWMCGACYDARPDPMAAHSAPLCVFSQSSDPLRLHLRSAAKYIGSQRHRSVERDLFCR
jgi:hypothetical protein